MIITTAGRTTSELVSKAKKLANTYGLVYKARNGVSVDTLKTMHQDDVVVVGKERLEISTLNDGSTLFFHPNLAMVRAKRMFRGEEEPLVQTAKLEEGMSLIDCTLGLASDSIIASIAVGTSGSVTGIEGNYLLYLLAKEGLASFTSGKEIVDQALRKIKVVHDDHYSFLKNKRTNSVDIVYFDPMFHTSVDKSNGINSIRGQALTTDIHDALIQEAKRVARERIVIKDHFQSERFAQLGFIQQKRKTSLFHYGTIELH